MAPFEAVVVGRGGQIIPVAEYVPFVGRINAALNAIAMEEDDEPMEATA